VSQQQGCGSTVGMDVEMAHLLPGELGVRLEFVPTAPDSLSDHLGPRLF